MSNKQAIAVKKYLFIFILLLSSKLSIAQLNPTTQPGSLNRPQKDTSKSNTTEWKDDPVFITYEKLNSAKLYIPDTSLHTFHRPVFTQPWNRDLGNLGSPVNNMFFTPEYLVGPTLGYHIFDVYRFNIDSLKFYNTSRPYSVFSYQLGSKLEQIASIMHTQNIKPNWNFAFEYHKISSPGFYKVQRTNHDNACFSTNYKSLNKHYALYAAVVYNKQQNDENGGLKDASQLNNPQYGDRKTVSVAYDNGAYSSLRSTVTNVQRDVTFLLQHNYILGKTDTTYNEDSTEYTYKLKPLFSISHKMELSTEKHTYKDLTPDSFRYIPLFTRTFINTGISSGYTPGQDSVFVQQKWFWADNKLMLNGFLGKDRQLTFSAGIGNRFDQFIADPVSNVIMDSLPKLVYQRGYERNSQVSNYLAGEIKKEALYKGAWEYGGNVKLFVTGPNAGDFTLNTVLGKQISSIGGSFVAGFQQQLNSAPYAYRSYENAYTKLSDTFSKESVSTIYATVESIRFKMSAGVRNYVINNYIYIDEQLHAAQHTIPFNLTQVWLNKVFRFGVFVLDNNIVYQQVDKAPVNVPAVMAKHQFSFEYPMFKRRLKVATGLEVRYNTAYNAPGYSAILNRFYYQQSLYMINIPEAAVFLNFKIKRFRAYIMADNLQQMVFNQNPILYAGSQLLKDGVIPKYAGQDFVIRFGFSWPLVN